MGHYRSEMRCDRCEKHPCTCPRTPEPVRWLIDSDDEILTTVDYDKKHATVQTKYGPIPGLPLMQRMNMKLYDKKEEAEAALPIVLSAQIVLFEKHIKTMTLELKKRQQKLKRLLKKKPVRDPRL